MRKNGKKVKQEKFRVVCYGRTSDPKDRRESKEAKDHLSLEVQVDGMKRFLAGHKEKYTLVAPPFLDPGVSGVTKPDQRQGLTGALKLLKEKKADILLVYKFDRLARSTSISLNLRDLLRSFGASIQSASESFGDPSELRGEQAAISDLNHSLLSSFAEFERARIISRTVSARNRKWEKTGGYCGGTRPIGFRLINGAFVVDPMEARMVKRICQLLKDGYSLRAICRLVKYRGRFGSSKLYPSGLLYMIRSTAATWAGRAHYNHEEKKVQNPSRIISDQMLKAVQARLKRTVK